MNRSQNPLMYHQLAATMTTSINDSFESIQSHTNRLIGIRIHRINTKFETKQFFKAGSGSDRQDGNKRIHDHQLFTAKNDNKLTTIFGPHTDTGVEANPNL